MPRFVPPTGSPPSAAHEALSKSLGPLEDKLGFELVVRWTDASSEPSGLSVWFSHEQLTSRQPAADGAMDLAAAADELATRVGSAHAAGLSEAPLDVAELVERERTFDGQGFQSDVQRFVYRQSRRQAVARLRMTERRGLLFHDDESEEYSILLRLDDGFARLRESRLRLDDFDGREAKGIEADRLDENGEVTGHARFEVPVCPPLDRLEDGLQEILRRGVPLVLGRNPETGLAFLAHGAGQDRLTVYEYIVDTDRVDFERLTGFPPLSEGATEAPPWQGCLMCTSCGADLAWDPAGLNCEHCGASYPVVEGRPDFLAGGGPPTAPPEDPWAPNAKQKVLLYFLKKYPRGAVLDCGSGNASFRAPNLVNLEIFPFESVDVVGDGQRLPFRDNSIDAVISAAVLEHVPNPFEYCRELRRVLKPGGEVRIDSAFLQPFHGCPDHYFGTTRSGLVEAAQGFRPVGVGVAPGQTPFVALQTWLHAYAELLPDEADRERFRSLTVAELLAIPNGVAPEGLAVPPQLAQRVAAGVYLHGVKTGG